MSASAEEGIAGRLARPFTRHAIDRRILGAALSVTAAGIVVKCVAMGKEIAVAATFGRSDAMDAFLAAFLIPNLLINFIAESMNQALIPTLVRVRLQQGRERAQRLVSSSAFAMCVLLAGATVAMGISARFFFPLVAWNFSMPKLALAIRLFYALLPCVLLGGIAANCTAVLNTLGRFTLPALAPVLVPLTIVLVTVGLHGAMGIWGLAGATIAGMGLQCGVLAAGMQRQGYAFRLRWCGADEETREVARQFGPLLFSSVVASGGLLVDQGMAAMLPAGSVSALVFAGRFVSAPVTLLAGSISSSVAPSFSELVAREDWHGCRELLRIWTRRTALISTPLAFALIVGAHSVVRLTLEHGAFAAHDTRVVAMVLAMYAIQIPFFVVSRVFYRFVIAMHRSDLVFACGAINLGLDVVLNLVLMRAMGVAGIALATSLWTVSTCAFLGFWTRSLLAKASARGD